MLRPVNPEGAFQGEMAQTIVCVLVRESTRGTQTILRKMIFQNVQHMKTKLQRQGSQPIMQSVTQPATRSVGHLCPT